MTDTPMSGPRRLAVLLSVVWTALVLFLSAMDPEFRLAFFVVAGIVPIALAWGVWWVIQGFRATRKSGRHGRD